MKIILPRRKRRQIPWQNLELTWQNLELTGEKKWDTGWVPLTVVLTNLFIFLLQSEWPHSSEWRSQAKTVLFDRRRAADTRIAGAHDRLR